MLGLALARLLAPGAADAADAAHLALELRDCATLSESALREHLELELATLGLGQVSARLDVRCESGAVAIELTRASGARFPVEVRVDLRDTARAARERLIALAASELLAQAERSRVSEAERAPARPRAPAPVLARAEPERDRGVTAPQGARRPSELFVAGSVALDGVPKTALWGGSLGAVLGLGRSWSVLLDTRFERGSQRAELARVTWSSLSGFVGPSFRGDLGVLRPSVALGMRAGWLALAADAEAPNEGRSFTAPWLGLALPLRLGAELAAGVTPFAGVEAGYVLVPVHGNVSDGSRLVEHRGPWLVGNVGIAVEL